MLLLLLKTDRDEDLGSRNHLTERFELKCTHSKTNSHTLSHTVLVLFCCVWMYTCSLMHGRGHCVRSPAIKKPKGQGGKRRKPAMEEEGEEEGKGGSRGGVCFFSGARLQSEVDMEKPENGKMVQRTAGSRLGRAHKNLALDFTRLTSVKFAPLSDQLRSGWLPLFWSCNRFFRISWELSILSQYGHHMRWSVWDCSYIWSLLSFSNMNYKSERKWNHTCYSVYLSKLQDIKGQKSFWEMQEITHCSTTCCCRGKQQ